LVNKLIDASAFVEMGGRLREERERLGLSQEVLAHNTGISKLTQLKYEAAKSHPNGPYLASLSKMGGDVLYVITGERKSEWLVGDPLRQAMLDSFDRLSPKQQIEAVQYMALLAAGVAPSTGGGNGTTATAKVSKSILGFAVGNVVGKSKK
jgi:transcriptional regulator with XRE-family HTH domain